MIPVQEANMEIQPSILSRPEVRESYGPWMLAPRRSRRRWDNQEHKKGGQVATGGRRDISPQGVSQSRFAVLSNEGEKEEHEPHYLDTNVEALPRQNNMVKGKRPTVQVTEKQGSNKPPYNNMHGSIKDRKMASTTSPRANRNISRRAAAEAEHVLVRGSKNGESSIRKIINFDEEFLSVPETDGEGTGEHFQDPPDSSNPLDSDAMDADADYMQSDGEAVSDGLTCGN